MGNFLITEKGDMFLEKSGIVAIGSKATVSGGV
jgi:hypothetical protein